MENRLELGDLSPRRDWGYAPEYVTGLSWMLDVERPTELILATGEAHSVREATELAFSHLGLDYRNFVDSDPTRRSVKEPFDSVGNASLAWRELGWEAKTKLPELITLLVDDAIGSLNFDSE